MDRITDFPARMDCGDALGIAAIRNAHLTFRYLRGRGATEQDPRK